jgi:hypothetical protein
MDTPGGEVQGVDAVYERVAALAQRKRVTAENHGLLASAGYWIASAANEIVAMSPTVETGSIGVVILGYDTSDIEKRIGFKRVKIISRNAPNKAPELASEEGRAVLQEKADAIERVFISRVAQGRGVSEEKVTSDFGRGDVLIACDPDKNKPDAMRVGLVDRVISMINDRGKRPAAPNAMRKGFQMSESFQGSSDTYDRCVALKEEELAIAKADAVAAKTEAASWKAKCDDMVARIEASAKIATGDYPPAIKNLAVEVLSGKVTADTLRGAVIAWDAIQASAAVKSAVEKTNEIGDTPSQSPTASADGVIRDEAAFQAAVARFRGRTVH